MEVLPLLSHDIHATPHTVDRHGSYGNENVGVSEIRKRGLRDEGTFEEFLVTIALGDLVSVSDGIYSMPVG